MLPNLSALRVSDAICVPINTPFPDAARTAIENTSCTICFNTFGEESTNGLWTGTPPNWIVQCTNNHIVHKMCLKQQLLSMGDLEKRTKCGECSETFSDTIQDHVNPRSNRRVRPRTEEGEENVAMEEAAAAAREAEASRAEAVTEAAAELVTALREEQNLLFIRASRFGWADIVNEQIAADVDVNARDGDGHTALILASLYGHADIVNTLVGADADVNIADGQGVTALMNASYQGHIGIVNTLIAAPRGINVDAIADGTTALMIASAHGHIGIVNALIAAGAYISYENDRGDTALTIAREERNFDVVEALVEADAEAEAAEAAEAAEVAEAAAAVEADRNL